MKTKILFFIFLSIAGMLATLITGDTTWNEVLEGFNARIFGQSNQWNALLDERLPRLIVLISTGASLAVAGAVMQSLFQNPLASPSVLGISCGGSLMVSLVFILGWHYMYPYALSIAAFSGCLFTLFIVYVLSRRNGEVQTSTLILTGIAISTLLLSVQGAISYALRDQWQLMQTLREWDAGSTMDRSWKHVHLQLPVAIAGLMGCFYYRDEINILALGEEEAKNLGVEAAKVRFRLFICVALLTSGAIAAVGILPFFGLVLPHVIRGLEGPDNRRLIPYCMAIGGLSLVLMDLMLRLFDIHAFTIGNVSAILGGAFFLILLLGKRHEYVRST
jgi:iron complex transport system permease protein